MTNITNIIKSFTNKKVLIIGDVMLDRYLHGEVSRISPEAPIQILNAKRRDFTAGGAANCASNISSLGGTPILCSIIGNDENGDKLLEILKKRKVDTSGIIKTDKVKTIVKERIVSNNQQLLRIDFENIEDFKKLNKQELISRIKNKINKVDSILISDYAKGIIGKELIDSIKKFNKKNIPVIIDPKPVNKELYKGFTLVTPNLKEAKKMSNKTELKEIGSTLIKELNSNILITRGQEGMSLFKKDGSITEMPTEAKEVNDITGAGDTVISTIALALASKTTLNQAAILANHAASIVVAKFGTAMVSQRELINLISSENKKVKDLKDLVEISKEARKLNKKIVFTNGCFDIIHPGHTKFLRESKKQGDILIVAVNSDSSVKKLKGSNRPLIPENERAEVLSSLEFIDYIIIFNDIDSSKLIESIKPQICTKGSTSNLNNMPIKEKEIIKKLNCNLITIAKFEEYSTSKIINRINNNGKY